MEFGLGWIVLSCLVGYYAEKRGHSFFIGFLVSLILSPLIGALGVILTDPNTDVVEKRALTKGTSKKCPDCAEMIKVEARKCRFCGYDF